MSLALLLLSATQGALLTRTPLRPQLTCRRRSDAVALIGGIDPVEAIQHAHAAVATHLPVTTQLLSDADGLTDEARKAATGELGWWGTYIKFVEDGILGLRAFYESKGLSYPYGLAIFTFVLGVKLITLPLNWNQLSSAAEMKSIKPAQERVTTWYGDNDQIKNAAVGNLYDNLNINPLAGCLPALAQIPVFLGVYYSVTSIAKAAIIQAGAAPSEEACLAFARQLRPPQRLGPLVRAPKGWPEHPGTGPCGQPAPTAATQAAAVATVRSPLGACRRASSGSPTCRGRSPTGATASRG